MRRAVSAGDCFGALRAPRNDGSVLQTAINVLAARFLPPSFACSRCPRARARGTPGRRSLPCAEHRANCRTHGPRPLARPRRDSASVETPSGVSDRRSAAGRRPARGVLGLLRRTPGGHTFQDPSRLTPVLGALSTAVGYWPPRPVDGAPAATAAISPWSTAGAPGPCGLGRRPGVFVLHPEKPATAARPAPTDAADAPRSGRVGLGISSLGIKSRGGRKIYAGMRCGVVR